MIKKLPKESLADKIAGVLSAVPAQFDSDDENTDGTRAKLTELDDIAENDDDDQLLSKFRTQNVDLLADVDERYAGKKGSRKRLRKDSSDEASEDNEETLDNEGFEEAVENSNLDNDSSGDDQDEGSEEESENGDDSENEGSIALSEENDSKFQHLSKTNISEQVRKGLCVRNQMSIWENLLEMRIQMQKCLVSANKLPQKVHYKEMLKDSESLDFREKVKETQDSLGSVLDKFLTLQNLVIKKYPETKNLEKNDKTKVQPENESDEEIPSDTDEEIEESDTSELEVQLQKSKRRKLNEYENCISDLHGKYKSYRNNTIEKWNTKTRLSVTKNSGQTHSVVTQIEHLLGDKDKLRKRTQVKRSEYNILGQDNNKVDVLESNEINGDVKQAEEHNTEIFDDSDFYHQLLRELIEVKSADITDPVQLGRQWIQLQNLRSKMKRKIDTRATKGRKIRYAIHSKLVNFMAPMDQQLWTEEAKNELYSSLFGQNQSKRV